MTQVQLAKNGGVSFEMKRVAEAEGVTPEFIQQGVAEGTIVIPSNKKHKITQHCAIGKGTRVKVNANIGTSADSGTKESELEKLRIAVECKSDTVMDLSTGGDLQAIRRAIIEDSPIPVGTVPIYQAAIQAIQKKGAMVNMTADDLFKAIEEH
ncbi:MAG: phosphomethylpyrimidine synthase ThiC, partial [Candidatus Omnitrophica bacterium]|nr:phosphomethylpyrimidine synthase ThiC [Candidatus Omnitrophota bacterium]